MNPNHTYSQKNTTFYTEDNEEADRVLFMLENNSVLSESFKTRIQNIVITIISNLQNNETWIDDAIKKLETEMDWLIIFSDEFKHMLITCLQLTYQRQITINNEKKNR